MKTIFFMLGLVLGASGLNAQEMLKPIAPKFKPDPVVMEGQIKGVLPLRELLGGKQVSGNCEGFGQGKPSYVLPLAASFNYLNLKVWTEGVTVLVKGPDGLFCLQETELAGVWAAGQYQIWIGSKQKTNPTRYRLTVSETDQ